MIDWRHWHNEPYLVGGLIFLGWLYAILTGPLRSRIAPTVTHYPAAKASCFFGSLALFYLAVGSPLDQIGERFLLTAHMLQHQILIYPCALLFLVGIPPWLASTVTRQRSLQTILGFLTKPLVCGLIYSFTYSIWHAPDLYDWALQNKVVHVWEHVLFFGSALFYWWPIASPSPEYPPVRFGTQMLYQLFIVIGMTPVYAFLTFSSSVLYSTYEYAPRLLPGFGPADDQLMGGVTMELVGLFVALCAFGCSFYRWYNLTERPSRLPAVV